MLRTHRLAFLICTLISAGPLLGQSNNSGPVNPANGAATRNQPPRGLLFGLLGPRENNSPAGATPRSESASQAQQNPAASTYVRRRMGISQQAWWQGTSRASPIQTNREGFLAEVRRVDGLPGVGESLRQPLGVSAPANAPLSMPVATGPTAPAEDNSLIRIATRPGYDNELAAPKKEIKRKPQKKTEVFTIVRVAPPHVLPTEVAPASTTYATPPKSTDDDVANVVALEADNPAEAVTELTAPATGDERSPALTEAAGPDLQVDDVGTSVEQPQQEQPQQAQHDAVAPEFELNPPPAAPEKARSAAPPRVVVPDVASPVVRPPVLRVSPEPQRPPPVAPPRQTAPSLANVEPNPMPPALPSRMEPAAPRTFTPAEPTAPPQPTEPPELKVTITGPQRMSIGEAHACSAIVANISDVDARDVSVLILLNGERTRQIDVGHLPAGQTRKLSFELVPKQGGNLGVNAIATASSGVLAIAKGSVTVAEYELKMQFVGPRQLTYGEKTTYGLAIENSGHSAAEDVVINVELGGSRLDGLFKGSLGPGEQKVVKFQVVPRQAGFQSMSAAAFFGGVQRVSARAKLRVQHAQLEITAHGPKEKTVGEDASYTVRIKNVGDATAHNVLMTAHLPEGVLFKHGVDKIDFYDGVTWRVGTLGPGQSQAFQMQCELFEAGQRTIEFTAQGDAGLRASRKLALLIDGAERVRITQPNVPADGQPQLR